MTQEPSDATIAVRDSHLDQLVQMVGTAQSLTIRSETEYQQAAELLQNLKGAYNRAEESRKELVGPLNAEVKAINDSFRPLKERYEQGENVIKKAIGAYRDEQRKRAEAEQARLRDQQAKQAARLTDRAEKAEAKGDAEKAEALRAQADQPVPQVVTEAPKVEGMHTRSVNKWEFTDKAQVKPEYQIPDEKSIGAVVKSMGKRAEAVVGGIRVWAEEQVVSRGR